MTLSLDVRLVKLCLFGIVGLLLLVDLASVLPFREGASSLSNPTFLDLWNVDVEDSVPTWYSQTLLACSALIAVFIATLERGAKHASLGWWGLVALFTYLSIDEGVAIHERVSAPLRRALDSDGTLLQFAWVLPGAIVVVVLGFVYFRFWTRLPAKARGLTLLATSAWVGGALITEAISGYRLSQDGRTNLYLILNAIEEGLELTGAVLFVVAFLTFLALRHPVWGIRIGVGAQRRLTPSPEETPQLP